MNKLLTASLLIAILSILFTSCGKYTSKYSFRWGEDGLIYNSNNNKLFTGTVLDTVDVIIEFQVINGKKNGSFKTFYLDGQIEKSGLVINNENEGRWQYYYPNGQIESEGKFEDNVPEGKWISYYENGYKKCEGIYKDGKQQGSWIYYDKKGKIINMILYEEGKFIDLQERFV